MSSGDRVGGTARSLRIPNDDEPLYTVGQASDLLGVQPAFLRRLETYDAVRPARTAGGQRRYSRVDLEHIAAISGLMAEGMTLTGAMRIVELQAEVAELRRLLHAARESVGASRHPARNRP